MKENWIFLFLAVQPPLDVLAFFTQNEAGTVAGLIRLAMMIALVFYVLLKKRSLGFFAAMGITALVFLLHVANGFRIGYISFAQDVNYIAKVVSLPVTAICFCCCIDSRQRRGQTVSAFWVCAALVTTVVLLSAVTNSYTHTYIIEKIGISGWVIDSNRSCHSDILSSLAVFTALLAFKTEKPWLRYMLPPLLFIMLITNATTACYLTLLAVTAGFPVFVIFRSFLVKEKLSRSDRILLGEMAVFFALSVQAIFEFAHLCGLEIGQPVLPETYRYAVSLIRQFVGSYRDEVSGQTIVIAAYAFDSLHAVDVPAREHSSDFTRHVFIAHSAYKRVEIDIA